MLHPVWPDGPDLKYWSGIWLFSLVPLFCSSMQMEFLKKSSGLISVCLSLAFCFLFVGVPLVLWSQHLSMKSDPLPNRLLQVKEPIGLIIGCFLLFFGNIALYYYSEKSVACMLTFLFLAFYCLCTIFCIQPCTGFGILEFVLSASLNVALRHFGLRNIYLWLVLVACIFIDGVRYLLEPKKSHRILPVAEPRASEPTSNKNGENQPSFLRTRQPLFQDFNQESLELFHSVDDLDEFEF